MHDDVASATQGTMLDAALAHAKRGISVFPCGPDKRPLTKHGFKDATKDAEQVRVLWTRHPNALIGMPTGAVSRVFVLDLDVDPSKGADGEESLHALVNGHDPLPDTVEALTPRGGRHIYFRHPGGDTHIKCSTSEIGPHLDIRGDGGYVILPPSTLPDGRSYQWEGSSDPEDGVRSADAPSWLLSLVEQRKEEVTSEPPKPASEQIAEGQRNDTLFRRGRSLRARNLGDKAILAALREENAEKCNPPLADDEVVQLARSVCSKPPGPSGSREEDEWPDLVPFGSGADLPRLRPELLPGWAGAFAVALSASTETPPELAAGLILAAAAVPCARRLSVMVAPGYIEPTCLWVAVALPPGNRKSAVQSAVCAPLIEWERKAGEDAAPDIAAAESEVKTLQARANAARAAAAKAKDHLEVEAASVEAADLEARIPEVPAAPQLWTSDATPERLGPLLADQGECLAWLSAEAGLFDLLAGRYSRGIPNLDLVLKAWSGDPERVDRGSRPPVYLRHPRLTIGLAPQSDVLRGLSLQPGFRGRGLLGRFCYLLPPSPLGFRHLGVDRPGARIPEPIEAAYRDGIAAMLDWPSSGDCGDFGDNEGEPKRPHLLRLAPAAYQDWLAFARAVEARMRPGADLEGLTDLAGKVPGTAARIAAVMHGIERAHGRPWEAQISADTMASALEVAAVMLEHGKAVMDMMGADPTVTAARRVWEWLERGRRTDATLRDAWQALKGQFARMAHLSAAVEALAERGYVRTIDPQCTGPGRPPSPQIEVRPDIAETWR